MGLCIALCAACQGREVRESGPRLRDYARVTLAATGIVFALGVGSLLPGGPRSDVDPLAMVGSGVGGYFATGPAAHAVLLGIISTVAIAVAFSLESSAARGDAIADEARASETPDLALQARAFRLERVATVQYVVTLGFTGLAAVVALDTMTDREGPWQVLSTVAWLLVVWLANEAVRLGSVIEVTDQVRDQLRADDRRRTLLRRRAARSFPLRSAALAGLVFVITWVVLCIVAVSSSDVLNVPPLSVWGRIVAVGVLTLVALVWIAAMWQSLPGVVVPASLAILTTVSVLTAAVGYLARIAGERGTAASVFVIAVLLLVGLLGVAACGAFGRGWMRSLSRPGAWLSAPAARLDDWEERTRTAFVAGSRR